jgi:hypothetical protein
MRTVDVIRRDAKCYALLTGTMRAGHVGYADAFEKPKLFPGRMKEAASWGTPTDGEKAAKPWLPSSRRYIFIGDMGDVLSRSVPFEFLKTEVIDQVGSDGGKRPAWLWLTKQPSSLLKYPTR